MREFRRIHAIRVAPNDGSLSRQRTRMTAPVFGSFLIAIVAASGMFAGTEQLKLPHVNFTDQKLENGLRVIIAEDHAAPVFAIALTYNAGSRDEQPGRTGFAHLFEHMMFQGSENVGKGEHFILVLNNGGDMNGTTTEDRTSFFETLPSNQLDLALFLESDRMKSLVVNQSNLDNQRNAVEEERRFSVDNQPYGRAFLEISNISYDNFAYKHPPVGEMADLNAATLQEVEQFYRRYYAPNNAVLTLFGDLNGSDAFARVKKYFGGIPSQPAPPVVHMYETPHLGMRSEVIEDPLARSPLLIFAWHIPPGNSPDNYAMQVIASVLGQGETSRLYRHLVREKQLATKLEVKVNQWRGPSLLYISVYLASGASPEECQKQILEQVDVLKKNGVHPEELQRARIQYLREQILIRQSDLRSAVELGDDIALFNDPNLINTSIDRFNAVTVEQATVAARKYFDSKELSIIFDLPETKDMRAAQGSR
jgi:zinc protease